MSISFLVDGNSSDLTNATLEATMLAVAEAAGVDAELVDVSIDVFEADVDEDVVEGNLTLAAELTDVNATLLTAELASVWNVSAASIEVELLAASVRLLYNIRVPNCSAANADYEDACDGVTEEAPAPTADDLLEQMATVGEAEISQRFGVTVTIPTVPIRRWQRYVFRSSRMSVRIRSLGNTTDAAERAAVAACSA